MSIKLYNLNTICIAFVQIFWTGSQLLHVLKSVLVDDIFINCYVFRFFKSLFYFLLVFLSDHFSTKTVQL